LIKINVLGLIIDLAEAETDQKRMNTKVQLLLLLLLHCRNLFRKES
jgi:hypothetical protein